MRKILFVITKSVWGGAGRYVYDLATTFSKDNDVIVAAGGQGFLIERLHDASIRTLEIKTFERDINLLKEFQSFFELLSILKTERPDIVHLNSSKAGGTGAFAVRMHNILRRAPKAHAVFTAHGWAFKEDRPFLSTVLIKKLSWLTVLFSHAVITVSDEDYRRAQWMPWAKHKLYTVRNGIATPHFASHAESLKKLGMHADKKFHVGTIAELHHNKGLLYALGAIEILHKEHMPISYTIVGEGEDRAQLEALIHMKDLKDIVTLTGRIRDASMYMPAFDVFLLPSIKEGLPYTILEAGAAGLPIVATSVGGIPEIIDDMQSGMLVRPKNAREIAGALRLFVEDENKRKAFGERLRTTITSQFTLEAMVSATQRIYDTVSHPQKNSSVFDKESATR